MSALEQHGAQPDAPHLVLITGAGRSGTSTAAGVFARLGFHVPQPVLKENESNPRGFYESWWPVRFHNRLMKRADITPTDGRPSAASLMNGALDDKARTELRGWLAEQFADNPLVVVKDPRAAWVPTLWASTAHEIGADVGFMTMLRHPTEVIGSRKTYYATNQPASSMRTFAIRHLCGWVNQNLTLERLNRGQRRAFVSYPQLLDDWRPVVARMLGDLDLAECLPAPEREDDIDAFIEPALRRHQTDWNSFDLPENLIDIAEQTWEALGVLTESHGHDATAERSLDEISARYSQLHADAAAMSLDVAESMARRALKSGRRQGRQDAAKKEVAVAVRHTGFAARIARTISSGVHRLRSSGGRTKVPRRSDGR